MGLSEFITSIVSNYNSEFLSTVSLYDIIQLHRKCNNTEISFEYTYEIKS